MPKVGITLLPPWWALILWAGKRIENRAPSVANRLKSWRGLIALTASKQPESNDWGLVKLDLEEAKESVKAANRWRWEGPQPYSLNMMRDRGAHVVGIAELLDVAANGDAPTDPWAVPGQVGLVLGHVAEVEPVPCTGGRGVFRFGACAKCGRPIAVDGAVGECRKCKHTTPRNELVQPPLRVVHVFGPDGAKIHPPAAFGPS